MTVVYTKLGASAVALLAVATTWQITASGKKSGGSHTQTHNNLLKITNVKDGDTLSDATTLKILVPAQDQEPGSIALLLDGQAVSYGGSLTQYAALGAPTLIWLSTDRYANGGHLLELRDALGRCAMYRVRFSNDIYNIAVDGLVDPASLGRKDDPPKIARILATVAHAQPWTVRIESTTGSPSVIRIYHGTGAKINVGWDCKNSRGTVVPDDSYAVLLQAGQAHPHIETINKYGSV